jgi:hypothetical protein
VSDFTDKPGWQLEKQTGSRSEVPDLESTAAIRTIGLENNVI